MNQLDTLFRYSIDPESRSSGRDGKADSKGLARKVSETRYVRKLQEGSYQSRPVG